MAHISFNHSPRLRGRMRFKMLLLIVTLLLSLPAGAQDSEYPTLDALAKLEIPAFDRADVVRRLSRIDTSHTPPSAPPDYQIGDRESFNVPLRDGEKEVAVPMQLRGMTENVLIWVEEAAPYSTYRAQVMAEEVERDIVAPLQQLFDYAEPPGVDGDPRLYIVMVRAPEYSRPGIFHVAHSLSRKVWADSNQHEMMVINLDLDEDYTYFDEYIAEIIAHEYQHVLLHHRDFGEERWLNEALAGFAEYHTSGYDSGFNGVYLLGEIFLETPSIGLTHLSASDNVEAKYGAGALFMIFIAERYGEDLMARLQADSANGWQSVDRVLREHAGVSADEVFADWVLANYYLDAERGFGYQYLDPLPVAPQPIAAFYDFPALHSGSLPQYSSDYLALSVQGGAKLALRLTQPHEANLINVAPYEGDHFYFGPAIDGSDSRLTREIQLNRMQRIWLEYRVWHDLAEHYEYAYVEVSVDGGRTWRILPGEHTSADNRYGNLYADGYTGSSGGWLQERIDLTAYVPARILLRFEVLSNTNTSYGGIAIDDLRIEAIDFHDGFESADDAWVEEGWIRTDNRLPNKSWLQVVQETADGLHLSRSLLTGPGEMTVDLLPNVDRALVAVSPVVPQTALETEYALVVNLIDADGNVMEVSRDCKVTTTAGLNFRAAPNGNKIGLIPEGATLDALDRQGDWFQVLYNGAQGWVSAGYVTTQGNCP